MSKSKILVVEDEFIIAEDILSTLKGIGYEDVRHSFSYEDALEACAEEMPDLALLDINLRGEKDGIDLAMYMREHFDVPLIFLTSYADKTTVDRAKTVKPNGYLVKPFSTEDLYTSIEIALSNYANPTNSDNSEAHGDAEVEMLIKDAFFIKKKEMFHKVRFAEIRHIQADGSYLEIMTENERFLVRSSLNKIMEYNLPNLVRIHRSHAVNLLHIDAISSQNVSVNGELVPISRSYRDDFLKRFKTLL